MVVVPATRESDDVTVVAFRSSYRQRKGCLFGFAIHDHADCHLRHEYHNHEYHIELQGLLLLRSEELKCELRRATCGFWKGLRTCGPLPHYHGLFFRWA